MVEVLRLLSETPEFIRETNSFGISEAQIFFGNVPPDVQGLFDLTIVVAGHKTTDGKIHQRMVRIALWILRRFRRLCNQVGNELAVNSSITILLFENSLAYTQ